MSKKLPGKALAEFEANRDVWHEVLDSVWDIKAGGGKRSNIKSKSYAIRLGLPSCGGTT